MFTAGIHDAARAIEPSRARRARDHRRDPAPRRQRPARRAAHRQRLVEGHRPARGHARGQPADPRHDRDARSTASSIDSQVEGRVIVEAGRAARALDRARPGDHRRRRAADRLPTSAPTPRSARTASIERAEVEHSILLAGSSVRDLDGRMESSLLGRNVAIAPRRPPAARLPLHGRRQLARSGSSSDAAARHRRRRDARPGRRRAPRAARGHEVAGARPAPSSTSPTPRAVARAIAERAARRGRQLRRVDRRRRRRGATRPRADAVNGDGAGNVARAAAAAGARLVHVSTDYVFDGDAARRRYVESDPAAPARRLRPHQARRRARPSRRPAATHAIVRTAWLFGAGGRNFVDTMLALGAERDEVRVVDDQIGCPTWTGHLAPALLELARDGDAPGIFHVAGGGPLLVARARARGVPRRPACDCRVLPTHDRRRSRGPRRGRPSACSPASATTTPLAAAVAGGPRRATSPQRRRRSRMKLLVCGGAGLHRLELRRACASRDHGDEVVVLDKLTYAGRKREPRTDARRTCASCTARSRTPTPSPSAIEGVDAVVNFAAETHVDRSIAEPDAFVDDATRIGTYVLLEAARAARACATCRSRPTRSTARSRRARSPRSRRSSPPRPTARRRPAPTCSSQSYFHTYGLETRDLPRLEQLRALPVPREADPADGPQRAARRPAAGLRRRHAGAQLALRRGLRARRSATCSSTARAGEVYNVGGPDECPNIEVVKRIIELTGNDESLIEYVTDRPGHDRRYSLGSEKVRALGWEAQVRFAEGLDADGRLVSRQRRLVGADPLRRLPRVLRAPVRARARCCASAHENLCSCASTSQVIGAAARGQTRACVVRRSDRQQARRRAGARPASTACCTSPSRRRSGAESAADAACRAASTASRRRRSIAAAPLALVDAGATPPPRRLVAVALGAAPRRASGGSR